MSFLFGGQLSTDKLVVQCVYIFTVSFWAGIPGQIENGTRIKSSTNRNDKINSIWIAVTNDVIEYAITKDVIKYAITNYKIKYAIHNMMDWDICNCR